MHTLILYAFYEYEQSITNLRYFLNITNKHYIDLIIIVNGVISQEVESLLDKSNAKILRRENIGYDFGAYGSSK